MDGRPMSSLAQFPTQLPSSPHPSSPHPASPLPSSPTPPYLTSLRQDLSPSPSRFGSGLFDPLATTMFSELGRDPERLTCTPPPSSRGRGVYENSRWVGENSSGNVAEGDVYMELKLLKQQFLLFKENSDKTSQVKRTY